MNREVYSCYEVANKILKPLGKVAMILKKKHVKTSFVFALLRHGEMQRMLLSAVLLLFMLNYAFCNEVWNFNCEPWSKLRKEQRLDINIKCNNLKCNKLD